MLVGRHVRPHSISSLNSLELDDFQFAESGESSDATAIDDEFATVEEEEPFLSQDPSSPTPTPIRNLSSRGQRLEPSNLSRHTSTRRKYSRHRPASRITAIMEKIRGSKVARIVDKLAVSSEPGLTNAQLMLTNFDLKPGSFQ